MLPNLKQNIALPYAITRSPSLCAMHVIESLEQAQIQVHRVGPDIISPGMLIHSCWVHPGFAIK